MLQLRLYTGAGLRHVLKVQSFEGAGLKKKGLIMDIRLFAFTVLVSAVLAATVRGEEKTMQKLVVNPWIRSDGSVDCRTVGSIVDSLVTKEMSDEEKVITIYHWLRRMISHGHGEVPDADRFDFHKQIHMFGTGSCISQTTPLYVLLKEAGFKSRTWSVSGGHHCMQVFYDDQWHLFDPHMNFYVYNRGTPRSVASIEQIKNDPSLVSDAVKEGRACPGFLLCGDKVSTFATSSGWHDAGNFPEGRKVPIIEEPFGNIVLRRGETYIRTWQPGEYWWKKHFPDNGPYHSCCSRDSKDSVNWPVFEPHAAKMMKRGTERTVYRHWAAGKLVYAPDLAGDGISEAAISRHGLQPGRLDDMPVLLAGAGGGEIVFAVKCPYVIAAGELELVLLGAGDVVAGVAMDGGDGWKALNLVATGNGRKALLDEEVSGSYDGYQLKLGIPAGAGLSSMKLTTHFQVNPYSLPYLVPGRNKIRVEAQSFGAPVNVTYKYSEGEDWQTPREITRTFDKNGDFELDVKGPKYPRMRELVLSVDP